MSNNKISSEYNRVIVAELVKTYLVSKEYTERPECDVVSQDTLMIKRRIRYYIENVIFNILDDEDRFIIQNEVILNKKGPWYEGYLSSSTYYRHRKKAYANFLSCFND